MMFEVEQTKGGTSMIGQAQVWLKTGPHDASSLIKDIAYQSIPNGTSFYITTNNL